MHKPKLPSNIKGILFDLGNTLYDKKPYIKSAFRAVADYLYSVQRIPRPLTVTFLERIWKIKTSHYEFLFTDLLDIIGIHSAKLLDEVLQVYHSHKKGLKPYRGVPQLLGYLKKHYKIGLVTDGNPQMQRAKVKALGWEKLFDTIVYTAEYDKSYLKPNPFVYQLAVEKMGLKPGEAVYVGDNPEDDFVGAKQLGIFTIRILQGEFKKLRLDQKHEADFSIKNIGQLKTILTRNSNTDVR